MKTRYIVTYDIADADRLRRVHQTMKGAGEWLQYSVFECDLSDREKQELVSASARLAYPIRDGVPIMLPEEARELDQ